MKLEIIFLSLEIITVITMFNDIYNSVNKNYESSKRSEKEVKINEKVRGVLLIATIRLTMLLKSVISLWWRLKQSNIVKEQGFKDLGDEFRREKGQHEYQILNPSWCIIHQPVIYLFIFFWGVKTHAKK